jgi:hypothetical protein
MPAMHCNHRRSANLRNLGLANQQLAHRLGAGHLIVNAALNEVCNGIAVFEFETRIGADRERVTALLKEVGALLDKMDSPHE